MSWHELWAAAVAVMGMCVSKGDNGVAYVGSEYLLICATDNIWANLSISGTRYLFCSSNIPKTTSVSIDCKADYIENTLWLWPQKRYLQKI